MTNLGEYKMSDLDKYSESLDMVLTDGSTREERLSMLGGFLLRYIGDGEWSDTWGRFKEVTGYDLKVSKKTTDKELDFHIKNYQRALTGVGCVYLLSTWQEADGVKIGRTSQNVVDRRDQVCRSSSGRGFRKDEVDVSFVIYTDEYTRLEATIHRNIKHLQIKDRFYTRAREWFNIEEEKAINFMLKTYEMITSYPIIPA